MAAQQKKHIKRRRTLVSSVSKLAHKHCTKHPKLKLPALSKHILEDVMLHFVSEFCQQVRIMHQHRKFKTIDANKVVQAMSIVFPEEKVTVMKDFANKALQNFKES
jgi:hypothetical protein